MLKGLDIRVKKKSQSTWFGMAAVAQRKSKIHCSGSVALDSAGTCAIFAGAGNVCLCVLTIYLVDALI